MTWEIGAFIFLLLFTLINTILSALLRRDKIDSNDLKGIRDDMNWLKTKHEHTDEATTSIGKMHDFANDTNRRVIKIEANQGIHTQVLQQVLAELREQTKLLVKISKNGS